MKRIIALSVFLAFAASTNAQDIDRTMGFSLNPLGAIGGNFEGLYQLKLTDYLALTVPARFAYSWVKGTYLSLFEKGGFITQTRAPIEVGGGFGARFLLARKGLNDTFYLEPRVTLEHRQLGFTFKDGVFDNQRLVLTPMARAGWDWYWDSGFYMGFGFGVGFDYFIKRNLQAPESWRTASHHALTRWYFDMGEKAIDLAWDIDFRLGFAI